MPGEPLFTSAWRGVALGHPTARHRVEEVRCLPASHARIAILVRPDPGHMPYGSVDQRTRIVASLLLMRDSRRLVAQQYKSIGDTIV